MGELKGQLLSLLTVLVIFGAIGGSLYAAFNTTKDKIVTKLNEANDVLEKSIQKSMQLLEFKD